MTLTSGVEVSRPKNIYMCVSDFSLEKIGVVGWINIYIFFFLKFYMGCMENVSILCRLSVSPENVLGSRQKPRQGRET